MEKGNISNEFPSRILVNVALLTEDTPEVKRVLGIIPVTKINRKFDRIALNKLWQFTSRMGVTLELFDTGCTQEEMDKAYELLDRAGINPFRSAVAYDSLGDLVRELPYRPDVIGVLDLPEKAFVYGSKYFDLNRI